MDSSASRLPSAQIRLLAAHAPRIRPTSPHQHVEHRPACVDSMNPHATILAQQPRGKSPIPIAQNKRMLAIG
jgi:hypothetical protein